MTVDYQKPSLFRELVDPTLDAWRPKLRKIAFGLTLVGFAVARIGYKLGEKL